MDRNFRTFLILSTAMLLIFIGLQRMFLPNVPPQAQKKAPNAAAAPKDPVQDADPDKPAGGDEPSVAQSADEAKPAETKPSESKPDEPLAADLKPSETRPSETKPEEKKTEDPKPADAQADAKLADAKPADAVPADAKLADAKPADAKNAVKEQLITLGSMDPAKGYRLLPTFTTRGGAIERIELVDEKKSDRFRYRAIEHRGGYLGYLGWRVAPAGVLITTVPDGSPAALAKSNDVAGGLQVGDILVAIDDIPVTSYDAVQRVLKNIKAGSTVQLAVSRPVNGVRPIEPMMFEATLSQPPLDVVRTQEFLSEQVPGNLQRLSCLTTLASLGSQQIPIGMRSMKYFEGTLMDNWELHPLNVPGGEGVEFRLPLATALQQAGIDADLVMVKRYRLFPIKSDASDKVVANAEAYTLDFETVVENHSSNAVELSVRHEALAGVTLEGWWYSVKVSPYFFRAAGQRDVRFCDADNNHQIIMARSIYERALKKPLDEGLFVNEGGTLAQRTLKYVGVDSQYFAAAFLPHPDDEDGLKNLNQAGTSAVARVKDIVNAQGQATNTAVWFDTGKQSVAAGESFATRYRVFAGPKDTRTLYYFGLDRFIEYGWIPWLTKPLSFVLYGFYSLVRNYGIAIIMMTLLVRGAMFPLGRSAALNGQKMQEMQPEMKRINDQYKDDMQKRAEAMRELYAKYNFRPFASCLPLFVQLPVLTALYRCLSVDISLRQEPLIPGLSWCSNLAGPDMLFDWSSWMPEIIAGRGTGYLGPYFNILPVITVTLFLVQQKVLMPKANDEQMQMTQNMMQIMTVFMGVLFFKVPSGLCIYFITSSLWSLAERQLVKKYFTMPPSDPALASQGSPASASRSSSSKSSSSKVITAGSSLANKNKSEAKNKATDKKAPPAEGSMAARWAELREMLDKPAVRSTTQRNNDKRPDRKKKRRDP